MSKKKIIEEILNYVFETYKDDENIQRLFNEYYAEEAKLATKRNKSRSGYYLSKQVRNFLEPIVDAEYYKLVHYDFDFANKKVIYDAMKQLKTKEGIRYMQRLGDEEWQEQD